MDVLVLLVVLWFWGEKRGVKAAALASRKPYWLLHLSTPLFCSSDPKVGFEVTLRLSQAHSSIRNVMDGQILKEQQCAQTEDLVLLQFSALVAPADRV